MVSATRNGWALGQPRGWGAASRGAGTFFPLCSPGGQAQLPAETGADASPTHEVHSSDEAGEALAFPSLVYVGWPGSRSKPGQCQGYSANSMNSEQPGACSLATHLGHLNWAGMRCLRSAFRSILGATNPPKRP